MISLETVSKRYGDEIAVNELSLSIGDGELCVLVGPSGCGKTTTLRMVNRLIEPSGGRILLDDHDIMAMDPKELRRGIGYVIQQGGLFPHRRVADNIAIVPRLLGWDKQRIATRVGELLNLVGLEASRYARRFPHELSGGERQRVGVARALAADPPVLLMDEPFAAVDPVTRLRLQDEFLSLQSTLRKTIVFVTHDIDEAARMGDRIAVLSKGGVLEQHDSPAEVLGRPATGFVADFVGADRGVKRLAVVGVAVGDLFVPPVVLPGVSMSEVRSLAGSSEWAVVVDQDQRLHGWITVGAGGSEDRAEKHVQKFAVQVTLGTSLKRVLGSMLEFDISWVPVVEGERFLGVVTPNGLHAAMRRSVGGEPLDDEG